MGVTLIPDGLWDLIEPLLAIANSKPRGGRPRLPDRACLTGIIFILQTGISSRDVAQAVGLWFRHDLLETPARLAGSWDLGLDPFCSAELALPFILGSTGPEPWSIAALCEQFLGPQTGPNPADRAKLGNKRHLICDRWGITLAIQLTAANKNDSQQALAALVDAIPSLQGERVRPRNRPRYLLGDRGYDARAIRRGLRARHIVPWMAKRNTAHGSGLSR